MAVRSPGLSRKGDRGDPGKDSVVPGPKGADSTVVGPAGKSAYQLATLAGFAGTEAQWLASLKGGKGDTGAAGGTLIGTVIIGQTAAVALVLGIREVTAALIGTVPGERYTAFCRSYKLNNGASVAGRPAGYAVIDCACNTAGQIIVSLQAPLLTVGQSYALTCDIVRINAAA